MPTPERLLDLAWSNLQRQNNMRVCRVPANQVPASTLDDPVVKGESLTIVSGKQQLAGHVKLIFGAQPPTLLRVMFEGFTMKRTHWDWAETGHLLFGAAGEITRTLPTSRMRGQYQNHDTHICIYNIIG